MTLAHFQSFTCTCLMQSQMPDAEEKRRRRCFSLLVRCKSRCRRGAWEKEEEKAEEEEEEKKAEEEKER